MNKNKKVTSAEQKRQAKASERTVRSVIKNPAIKRSINFTPQTENQKQLVEQIKDNSIIFATGYPGTGKTFVAIAAAIIALIDGECDKILVTRPAVVAGNEIGFTPGDELEKQDVYMHHIYDAFTKLLPKELFESFVSQGKIEIRAVAFMRGTNFENTYAIIDEAENLNRKLFYLLMTRVCEGSKVIFCGDSMQTDLKKTGESGLDDAVYRFEGKEGFGVTKFTIEDCRRSKIVQEVIKGYADIL